MKKIALYLLAGTFLLGCGGDDSNPTPTPTPTKPTPPTPSVKLIPGFYEGITEKNELLEGFVDEDSRLWISYENNVPSETSPLGFIKSKAPTLTNDSKFSTLVKHYPYNRSSPFESTLTGNVYENNNIEGISILQPSVTKKYSLRFVGQFSKIPHTFDNLNNREINSLLSVTSSIGVVRATISFTTNGNFTGSDNKGCTMSGKLAPVVSTRYYVSTVTFGLINCDAAGETFKGISVLNYEEYEGDQDDYLIILATNEDESKGMYFGN